MQSYVTCGRGTEHFAHNEILDMLKPKKISCEDGKVFFTVDCIELDLNGEPLLKKLLELKTVERVYVALSHFPLDEIRGSGKVKFLRALKDRVVKPHILTAAVKNVRRIRAFHSTKDLTSLRSFKKAFGEHEQEIDSCTLQSSPDKNESKMNKEELLSCLIKEITKMPDKNFSSGFIKDSSDKKYKEKSLKRKHLCQTPFILDQTNFGNPSSSADFLTAPSVEETLCLIKRNKLEEELNEKKNNCLENTKGTSLFLPPQKLQNKEKSDNAGITFRFSVKCAGWCRKWLQPQRLAKECGIKLGLALGWTVDLRHPEIEICVHLNDDFVTVGIPLTQHPLSKRDYILDPGLRTTIASIMASIADIQTGDCVLDPMCGKGTILIEAAMSEAKSVVYIGCDKNKQQLQAASRNVNFAGVCHRVHLMQADAVSLPLRNAMVDKVVCDAPFGNKFTIGDESALQGFYKQFLQELHRVLVPGGYLVLLTSQELCATVKLCISCISSSIKSSDCTCHSCDCIHHFSDSTSHPCADPVSHPCADPVSHPCADPVSHPCADPVSHPCADPVSHPCADSVSHPSGKPGIFLSSQNHQLNDQALQNVAASVNCMKLIGTHNSNDDSVKLISTHNSNVDSVKSCNALSCIKTSVNHACHIQTCEINSVSNSKVANVAGEIKTDKSANISDPHCTSFQHVPAANKEEITQESAGEIFQASGVCGDNNTAGPSLRVLTSERKSGLYFVNNKCGFRDRGENLTLLACHYVKLGETHAQIMILQKLKF